MEVILGYPLWLPVVFVMGACVGSFLNVVIYRVPLGVSVSNPKRSYCPHCRKGIPWYRNLPILTWLLQRGKCAECGAPIAFRYVLVEILTALLFLAGWCFFVTFPTQAEFSGQVWHEALRGTVFGEMQQSVVAALLVMVFAVLLLSIGFIDAEHMVIPMIFCWAGMILGVLGNSFDSTLVILDRASDVPTHWWTGVVQSGLGLAVGWGLLAGVVIVGKIFLGERRLSFDEAEGWSLREPESDDEELCFVLGEERIGWSELFYRPSDRIEIVGHGILVDGKRTRATEMTITREAIAFNDKTVAIADLTSLEGKASKVVIPREAMGAGDPPLMGMIGAFIGWHGVFFALFASCLYALVAAVLCRVGFGRALPFGPFLALGGLTWIFGGWMLWSWYFESIAGFQPANPPLAP